MADRVKGWFITKDRDGDRTVNEQLSGLEPVLERAAQGADVLDLGCAEGLISKVLHDAGAQWVLGLDVRAEAVRWANKRLAVTGKLAFVCADLNRPQEWGNDSVRSIEFGSVGGYDIVLALSIAHKLDDPAAFLTRAAACARDWLVIRLPGPVIDRVGAGAAHKRDLAAPVDVPILMRDLGFTPLRECEHPRREWTWIYQRVAQ
ncbi:MAG: class I SAM-dependent methyltransferase [Rhodospirillaceae bacterium]